MHAFWGQRNAALGLEGCFLGLGGMHLWARGMLLLGSDVSYRWIRMLLSWANGCFSCIETLCSESREEYIRRTDERSLLDEGRDASRGVELFVRALAVAPRPPSSRCNPAQVISWRVTTISATEPKKPHSPPLL